MSRFDTAMQQLRNRLTDKVGDPIIYRRGNDSVSLMAYSGKTAFKIADMGNVRFEWSDRDVIIAAEKLVLNGSRITPLKGDVIEITFAGEGMKTFEVCAPNDEQVWRYSDTCRSIIRIHCKQINS